MAVKCQVIHLDHERISVGHTSPVKVSGELVNDGDDHVSVDMEVQVLDNHKKVLFYSSTHMSIAKESSEWGSLEIPAHQFSHDPGWYWVKVWGPDDDHNHAHQKLLEVVEHSEA